MAKWTQKQLADHTGLTQPQISLYLQQGTFTRNDSLKSATQKIIKVRGEINSGHAAKNGIDRVLEAALLDRAKREEIEIRIAEKRGTLIPDDLFIDAVSAIFSALKVRLIGLPTRLRVNNTNLTHADIDFADDQVREFLTELSDDRFPGHIRARLAESRNGVSSDTQADSKPVGRRKSKAKLRKQP